MQPSEEREKLNKKQRLQKCQEVASNNGVEHISERDLEDTSVRLPDHLIQLRRQISTVTNVNYQNYGAASGTEGERDRLKTLIRNDATGIALDARTCVGRNEDTWREACESRIMNRVSGEVQCPKCHKRSWRAEVETDFYDSDSSLKARQDNRRPCECNPLHRISSLDDKYSLRNIFTSRNQDKFFNPKDLQNELGFSQYPDRIIGLRETNNFSRILNSYAQDGCKVRDSIRVSPLSSQKGEHLLFPFMALEAKKDEQDSWKDIYNQTVVPIFTMLNDQRHVLKALSTHVKRFGPTVWFFLTRGAEWRLYLAYQSEQDPEDGSAPVKSHEGVVTRSFEVWRGSVDNPDHALQLLLIVDIMLDWGRDIYRKQILSSLVIIAQSDDTLSRIDSNIFSQGATPLVGSVEINNSILQSSRLATAAPVPDPAMLNAPIINQTPLDSPERQIPTMLQQEMLYSQTTQFSPSAYFQPEYVSSVYPMQYQSIPACQHLKVETKLISVVLSTEMIVNCLQRLNHWLASHQIPGILNDLQTVLDNELRTNLLDDMIDLFLHATEPRMELSLQELMEIFKVWLGQPMAYDPASSDQPFLVSCRAAYSMDLAFSVHRDLYVITMDRNALQMLCENLLQITKNSVQLRRRYEADIGSYSVPPPSEIPSAIQRLLALPASKNLDLASRGACLTCTVDGGLCDNSWAPNLMTELQRWGVLSFPFVLCYSRTEFQQMSN